MRVVTLFLTIGIVLTSIVHAQNPVRATTDDGLKVLLYPNNTWRYAQATVQQSAGAGGYTKPASATTVVDIQAGSTRLSYDPNQWTPTPSSDRNRLTFQHADGDGYALIIRERLQMSLDALPEVEHHGALHLLDPMHGV